MKVSIRYKILLVLGALLLVAVGSYTVLASFIFMEQKTALIYDINHSVAVNTAAQIRSSLLQVAGQLRLYAISNILSNDSRFRLSAKGLRDNYVSEASLFQARQTGYEKFPLVRGMPALDADPAQILNDLRSAQNQSFMFWRLGEDFLIAAALKMKVSGKSESYVVVAKLTAAPFFQAVQSANLFESYLFRSDGQVLISTSRSASTSRDLASHPVLETVSRSPASQNSGVRSYDFKQQKWHGAFAPVGVGDLWFLTQANHSEVTTALSTLVQRSLLFGLIVATLTFIASILFSKRLTRNLKRLSEFAMEIGRGNLNRTVKVRSGDEMETLANTFNEMVSALRASREAIEKYNRELEDKVALRTQQLRETNAAIKEVQEKLLHTTQLAAVGEVAGRTAHELLNPLTAIVSRVERSRQVFQPTLAAAGGAPVSQFEEILSAWEQDYQAGGVEKLTQSLQTPSQVKPEMTLLQEDLENLKELAKFWKEQTAVVSADLEFVHDQAGRIHRIIDKMREFVRSSVKESVQCKGAIEEAVKTMADFLSQNGIRIETDYHATVDEAELNRDELIQIVTNLIRNAYQAMEASKQGTIRVRTQNQGHLLLVDIIDDGKGIPPDVRPHIFEQGFTTKPPGEGTGLGLAICRRYAHAFGGEVELLFSEPGGRGTCFRVTIPLKEASAA